MTRSKNSRILFSVFILNIISSIAILIAAFFSKSLALLADGLHTVIDAVTHFFNFYAQNQRDKLSDDSGILISEICATSFTGLFMLIGVIIITIQAIIRLHNSSTEEIENNIMLWTVVGCLFLKIISCILYSKIDHPGHHCASENISRKVKKKLGQSIMKKIKCTLPRMRLNIMSAIVHTASDLIQTILVLIIALIIRYTHFNAIKIDAIATIVISSLIGVVSLGLMMKSFQHIWKKKINSNKSQKKDNTEGMQGEHSDSDAGSEDGLLTTHPK